MVLTSLKTSDNVAELDPVWGRLRQEAEDLVEAEPVMANLAQSIVLKHRRFEDALTYRIAQKLANAEISALAIRDLADEAVETDTDIAMAARSDIIAVFERDPACHRYIEPLLFLKGYHALQTARVAGHYWRIGRKDLASLLQMRSSEVFGVDIHPGAGLGKGIMIDHASGVVVGETAVIGDDVSLLHGVTLGGTGKDKGDRHPKVGRGVMIGANASILGNIKIGANSRVGAGSVVLDDVPECKTVVGVPAKVVGDAGCNRPSLSMDQNVGCCDDE
ncbi:MAG: serine O-acetyltransferase [Pseudomonadota bacterium]